MYFVIIIMIQIMGGKIMIIMNGKGYNERIFNGLFTNVSAVENYNEIKKVTASCITKITINSNVDVNIHTSTKANDITAHLYGEVIANRKPKFSVKQHGNEIIVCAKSRKLSFQNDCVSRGLTLDIEFPSKTFEKLFIETKHANINIGSNIAADTITINRKHGNINISSNVKALCIVIDGKYGNINMVSNVRTKLIWIQNAHGDVYLSSTFRGAEIDCPHGEIDFGSIAVDSKTDFSTFGYITVKHGNVEFR